MIESTKHDRIYLQVCDDQDDMWCGEVTWCQDRIHEEDVEYVRADLAAKEIERLQAEVAKLEAERKKFFSLLDVACEVVVISPAYDKVREERRFAVDDIEYDLFAAGWKEAVSSIKGASAIRA